MSRYAPDRFSLAGVGRIYEPRAIPVVEGGTLTVHPDLSTVAARRPTHGGDRPAALTPPTSAPGTLLTEPASGRATPSGLGTERSAAVAPVDPARARGGRPSAVAAERRAEFAADAEACPDPWENGER